MAKKKPGKTTQAGERESRPSAHVLDRLHEAIHARKSTGPAVSKAARAVDRGRQQIAKKLGEEAVEVLIEGVRGDKLKLVTESADVLFYLVTLWAALEIEPEAVWAELDRREGLSTGQRAVRVLPSGVRR